MAGSDPLLAVEPSGLLDGLPAKVLQDAGERERHLMEAETGLPPDPPQGVTPRPEYDPAATTVPGRERAKAAEPGAGLRAIQVRRSRYARPSLRALAIVAMTAHLPPFTTGSFAPSSPAPRRP